MGDPHRTYVIRCPVYGFIEIDDWEREIINHPFFQRLRRIRQLGWTDYIYPGAMHTRFEHSLGVMHMATILYEGIVKRSEHLLTGLGYKDVGVKKDRALVRLAALLHDVGHAPFSHASEELFPLLSGRQDRYRHEHYSAEIVRRYFKDVIENHPLNIQNYGISAERIACLLEGSGETESTALWQELIVGQMDADRMDYLLRDSLHAGVDYGRFDWRRLVHTVELVPDEEGGTPRMGVSKGGWHAAEGLILARYFMFTQVYFHKTRVAYDYHLRQALAEMLPDGEFPSPQGADLEEYLRWDDWRVLGLLAEGKGGKHGKRLVERNHYRLVAETPETPTPDDLKELEQWKRALGDLLAAEESAAKSWYKLGSTDIPVITEKEVSPLSEWSNVVKNMCPIGKILLYTRPEDTDKARRQLRELKGKKDD